MNTFSFSLGTRVGGVQGALSPTPSVRLPAVAGQFYPGQASELAAMMDRLMAEAPSATPALAGPVRAMICPHAGFKFSGKAAAANFKLLKPGQYSRVIVIGPSHYVPFRGASVPDYTAFRTPLGDIPVDREACEALQKCPVVTKDPSPHQREHSLEVELPFLQRVLGDFQLVPVVTGQMAWAESAALAVALSSLWDWNTLLVASSDFCHYGPNFRYEPFGKTDREHIAQLDAGAIEQILAQNASGFEGQVAVSQNTVCGRAAIGLLLRLAANRSLQAQEVSYSMSGDLTGDFENSVSYASIVFCQTDKPAISSVSSFLNDSDQRMLMKIARDHVEQAARNGIRKPILDLELLPPALRRSGAVFVTLTEANERLRGCRGSVVAVEPLAYAVARSAIEAAILDTRFSPVTPDELPHLHLDVNVLGAPHRVDGIQDFVCGKQGLILQIEGHRGLFLPEVMTRQNWSREETLCQLSRKAGLPPQAWRNGYTLYTFETQAFGEDKEK